MTNYVVVSVVVLLLCDGCDIHVLCMICCVCVLLWLLVCCVGCWLFADVHVVFIVCMCVLNVERGCDCGGVIFLFYV